MTEYDHLRRSSRGLLGGLALPLGLGRKASHALCGARLADHAQNSELLACPDCLIAQATPTGYRLWRIEHGLTTHFTGPDGAEVFSVEESFALAVVLIAVLSLVPLPWAIVAFLIAGLVLHLWLHSHDRCAGGCAKSPSTNDAGETNRPDESGQP